MALTRVVRVGNVPIGGGYPISVQSMTNTKTVDVESTVAQVIRLADRGCDIVRVSVPDKESATALRKIVDRSPVPLVADIHFDYNLAVESIKNGVAKIRLNPGNIGEDWKLREIVKAAREFGVPVRVGANSGSIEKRFAYLEKATAIAESALAQAGLLEKFGFEDIVISVKSSSVSDTVRATSYVSERADYPLHLGVTEAGFGVDAVVKSSIGIGTLLLKGIGDTLRVSVSGDPLQEVDIALSIMRILGMRNGPDIIACPTCARTEIEVEKLARDVKGWLSGVDKNLKVAVMGCVVNGVGEGKDADLGIAGTRSGGVIFMRGEVVERIEKDNLEERFKYWISLLVSEEGGRGG